MTLKVSARDVAIGAVAASLGASAALFARLPTQPDENNMLGLIGSFVGAAVAVIAGLIVLARQFETTDERHLETIRALLTHMRGVGSALSSPKAPLNPAPYVKTAFITYSSARSVALKLQSSGAGIAIVAQKLEHATVGEHLRRMLEAGPGVAGPDLIARSEELVGLADQLRDELANGL